MAGLDGIKQKIEPPKPMDVDLYELEPEERKHVKNTPGSLNESLAALEADHAFLLEGGVFTPDLIETWLAYKRAKEVDPVGAAARIRTSSSCTTTFDLGQQRAARR